MNDMNNIYNETKRNLIDNLRPHLQQYVMKILKLILVKNNKLTKVKEIVSKSNHSTDQSSAAATCKTLFRQLLSAWDEEVEEARTLFDVRCEVSEDEVNTAMQQEWVHATPDTDTTVVAADDEVEDEGDTQMMKKKAKVSDESLKRPPLSDFLNTDCVDLPTEISRYTRTEIIRIMCILTKGGRDVVRERGVSTRPSAVAMVWAILRGVNDMDWVKYYGN